MSTPTTTRQTLATLAAAGIYITVTAEPETSSAYHDLSDCMSKGQIRRLLEKAETNVWLWCQITIRAEHTDDNGTEYSAEEYLGGCNYNSRADFIESTPGYFEDMLATVVEDIQNQVTHYSDPQPKA